MKKSSKKILKSLPSENTLLNDFLIKNKEKIMNDVIISIEDAVKKKKDSIVVFHFDNSNFFVSSNKNEYLENIKNAFSYFYENKNIEMCTKISRLEDCLSNAE